MTTKILSLLLALVMLFSITACKKDNPEDSDTDAVDTSNNGEYQYPAKGSVGSEFTILNYETMWECNNRLDFTEGEIGEKLPAAVYNRNRTLEEKLGIKLVEMSQPFNYSTKSAICQTLSQSVSVGDDEYDLAIFPVSYDMSLISQGALVDLSGVDGMNMDKEWWDKSVNDCLTVGGKMYAASGAMNLFAYDLTFSIYFNEKLMNEKHLDIPYNLVREGKWTLEKFEEYVQAAPDLKSAESYTWVDGSDAVYGIAGHDGAINAMMTCAGNDTVVLENGKYRLNLSSDRTIGIVDKLTSLFNLSSGYVLFGQGAATTAGNYYYNLFMNNQALFITCETKSGMVFTKMQSKYGLLPMPKYDESQTDYRSAISWNAGLFVMPITVSDTERVGKLLDAFNYESYKTVTPEYLSATQYQGLQDPDSVDMFNIIMNSRTFDFGALYGITAGSYENPSYDETVRNAVRLNNPISLPGVQKRFEGSIQGKLNSVLAAYGVAQ